MQVGSFRIQIDSLTCLVFRCPSLSKILAPDQFMTWFPFATWSVMALRNRELHARNDDDDMICYGRLVHFCCPALSVWPCERSVANRVYFFSVFLLSLPIISASLSNICTVTVVAWNSVHILQFALLCVDLLGGLAVVSVSCQALWPYLFHIYGISSQQSQITLLHIGWLLIFYSPVLTCFFFLCLLSFSFSDIGRASLCRKSTLDSRSSSVHS